MVQLCNRNYVLYQMKSWRTGKHKKFRQAATPAKVTEDIIK